MDLRPQTPETVPPEQISGYVPVRKKVLCFAVPFEVVNLAGLIGSGLGLKLTKLRACSVRRIFKRGEARRIAKNLEREIKTRAKRSKFQTGEDEDQNKRSSLRLSPFFCPDLGDDQK